MVPRSPGEGRCLHRGVDCGVTDVSRTSALARTLLLLVTDISLGQTPEERGNVSASISGKSGEELQAHLGPGPLRDGHTFFWPLP